MAIDHPDFFGSPSAAEQVTLTSLELTIQLGLENMVLRLMNEAANGVRASRELGKCPPPPKSSSPHR